MQKPARSKGEIIYSFAPLLRAGFCINFYVHNQGGIFREI